MHNSDRSPIQIDAKTLFLVWGAPHGSRRSQIIAQHLGMDLKHIYITAKQGKYHALYKYPYQFFATLIFLLRTRYQLIFIQDPPIFAALPVYIYSLFSSAKFVIDAHTPPLLHPMWEWTLPLHRFLSRRAITTLVTNDYLRDLVMSWGADSFVLEDPPLAPHVTEPMSLPANHLSVVMVSSASPDEPVEEVLKAARELPEIHFYITGDYSGSRQPIVDSAPKNVHFTGYLREDFFSLLEAVDVVMDLCVEDYQFLSGANEALWLGKPLITSQGPVLENYFNQGTIHIDNTAAGIRHALLEMREDLPRFKAEMLALKAIRRREWWEKATRLLSLVQQDIKRR
jgi:glycosyltransferase involved in cell wall biosynthesis